MNASASAIGYFLISVVIGIVIVAVIMFFKGIRKPKS